jgi:hypothetical protein
VHAPSAADGAAECGLHFEIGESGQHVIAKILGLVVPIPESTSSAEFLHSRFWR